MKPDYTQLGIRIAQQRQKLGLTQAQLGAKVGISHQHLSCIERASTIPSLEVVVRLAQVLGTTTDELLFSGISQDTEQWLDAAEMLRDMTPTQLELARNFFLWLNEAEISPLAANGGPSNGSDGSCTPFPFIP